MINEAVLKVLNDLKVDIAHYDPVERITSGSLMLDVALGGGFPRGRFTLIQGSESTGKSTLAIIAAKAVADAGGSVAYFDVENGYDPDWGRKFGLDEDAFLLVHPPYAERTLDTVRALIKTDQLDLIVVDSIAALVPKAELDGDMEDNQVGLLARKLGQFFRMTVDELAATHTAVIFINQERTAVGQWAPSGQIPVTYPGGRAKDFYSSITLKMWAAKTYEEGGQQVGLVFRGKTTKNKTAQNFQEYEVPVRTYPYKGVDKPYELFTLGKAWGLLHNREGKPYKSGIAVLSGDGPWAGTELGNGAAQVMQYIADNPDIAEELEAQVRQYIAAIQE